MALCGMQQCWSMLLIMTRTARSTLSTTTHQTVDMVSPCSMAAPTGTFSPKGKSHESKQSAPTLTAFYLLLKGLQVSDCALMGMPLFFHTAHFSHIVSSFRLRNIPYLEYEKMHDFRRGHASF